MPLQTSGAITFSNLQSEFGGSNPVTFSEYYRSGGILGAGVTGIDVNIPTSGQVSVSQYYGADASPTLNSNINRTDGVILNCNIWQVAVPSYGLYYLRAGTYTGSDYQAVFGPTQNGSSYWLYDSSGVSNVLDLYSSYLVVYSQIIPPNVNTIVITAWGAGGGSGGNWGNGGKGGNGGAGGYATTTLTKSSGHFSAGQFLNVVCGTAGIGGYDPTTGGQGGGASFAWLTNTPIRTLSTRAKINTVTTSNLALVAGGGGGGGNINNYAVTGSNHGGSGGAANSGNSQNGAISGSNSGATASAAGTGVTSVVNGFVGPADGGAVGYASSSITTAAESSLRNLIINSRLNVTSSDSNGSGGGFWTWPSGGGAGVFQGSGGEMILIGGEGTYGYSNRGAGGGSNKVYNGSGSVSNNGVSSTPPNSGSLPNSNLAYGGVGPGPVDTGTENYAGKTGKPGCVIVRFNT